MCAPYVERRMNSICAHGAPRTVCDICVPVMEETYRRKLMGSDAWFANFERIQAEHPEMDDDEASEAADEALRDQFADRADQLNDEKWERAYEEKLSKEIDFSKGVRGKYVDKGEKE